MEKATLNFPEFTVNTDKNGKRNTSSELFMAVIEYNEKGTLEQYTTTDFAQAVVEAYRCTNTSVNGACQFLRGVSAGSKLNFDFSFSDARPVGAVTALKAENNALKEQLEKALAALEAMKANN